MGDTHSACHNTSPGVAIHTPSHSVGSHRASSGFLCIDTWDMCSPSKPKSWTWIPWWKQSSIACSCSSDIYLLLRLLCIINSHVPLYIAMRCIASCLFSSNALKSLIIASGCVPSWRFWGPINSVVVYDGELKGAATSALEGRTLQAAMLFSRRWVRAWRLSSLISKQRMRRLMVSTSGR